MKERDSYFNGKNISASGLMLRELRQQYQLTQESLSYGICSVSKYSRIESGIDMPTETEFSGMMERLGEKGIIYSELYGDSHKRISMQSDIRNEAMLGNWDEAGEMICRYSQLYPPESAKEKQFLGFYEMVHTFVYDDSMEGLAFARHCNELLRLGRPEFRNASEIRFAPDHTEFLILNAIAIGMSEVSGDTVMHERALKLLATLLSINKRHSLPDIAASVRIGLLLNMCAIEIENGDLCAAESHLNLLLHSFSCSGGSYLYSKALLCQVSLLTLKGQLSAASELSRILFTLFRIIPEKENYKVLVF